MRMATPLHCFAHVTTENRMNAMNNTRQPFVPTRAPSRVSSTESSAQAKAGDGRFDFQNAPEGGNTAEKPYHAQNTNFNPGDDAPQPSPGTASIANGINKPLNLAGFAKRKNKPEEHGFSAIATKTRRSFDGATRTKPSELAPEPQQHPFGNAIARSFSPFIPSAQGLLSDNPRSARHSAPSALHSTTSADDLSSNKAHISTSHAPLANLGNTINTAGSQSLSSSANGRVSSRPSLDKIHETPEEDQPAGGHEFREHMLGGPRGGAGFDLSVGIRAPTAQRGAKRLQPPETDVEDHYDYAPAAKRYKAGSVHQDKEVSTLAYAHIRDTANLYPDGRRRIRSVFAHVQLRAGGACCCRPQHERPAGLHGTRSEPIPRTSLCTDWRRERAAPAAWTRP